MLKSYYDFYIQNGELKPSDHYKPEQLCKGQSVYEVFRIIDKVPLFLEEHLDRLFRSAALLERKPDLSKDEIMRNVRKLSEANKVDYGNIEIIINFCEPDDTKTNYILLFIEQRYPSKEQYDKGVGAITFDAVRYNPHIKQINLEMRERTSSTIAENNLYEVILVKEQKLITEGSRSNVYFIRGNKIYTPPVELVLPGITREKVFEICENKNLQIEEKNILLDEIATYDAAFISGTSPKILPLRYIDKISYNTKNGLMRDLIKKYDEMIDEYVKRRYLVFN
ncbi:MAG: aminotransferase class IV [Bacteroidales bacterium]|nr:aminotransferase class IV [Bacteroidales bacterium]MCF8388674.1 aminotransferase class IV [Bacteroidales bacterium]MCF8399470.1 aminotransferase class IV [Bacteroidales bacterium]